MKEKIYFAYGSNMSTKRLEARVGKVEVSGIAKLVDYQLRFNKSGADDSGKCNIMASSGNEVWGVLFGVSDEQKKILDVFEGVGHGYDAVTMQVIQDEKVLDVFIYEALAKATNESAKPYTWYKDFVCFGAKEHNLPRNYQMALDEVEAIDDKDSIRHNENRTVLFNR